MPPLGNMTPNINVQPASRTSAAARHRAPDHPLTPGLAARGEVEERRAPTSSNQPDELSASPHARLERGTLSFGGGGARQRTPSARCSRARRPHRGSTYRHRLGQLSSVASAFGIRARPASSRSFASSTLPFVRERRRPGAHCTPLSRAALAARELGEVTGQPQTAAGPYFRFSPPPAAGSPRPTTPASIAPRRGGPADDGSPATSRRTA